MTKKKQCHGGGKLTAKTARALAIQEFGTARGLTKSTSFVGAYFMEFGNLRIEICADAACIAVRVVLAHGTGSSVKYFDPDTLQENFKAIDKHRFGSGGSVNIWTVGAIERRECTKCRKQFHKISLTVPPDETPEAFYLRVIKAVTA